MKKISQKLFASMFTITLSGLVLTNMVSADSFDDAGAGFGFLVWCCIILCSMLIPVILAVFVYRDAQNNNVDNAILWALITFFTGLIGILIYFLAIKPDAVKKASAQPSESAGGVVEKK